MDLPTTSTDWLIAAVGSSLFWLTLSGMAVRAFRIDIVDVERSLKSLFERADRFTFNVADASRVVLPRILRGCYGGTERNIFGVLVVAS